MDAEWDGSSAGFADGDLVTVYWVREWMVCPRRAALRVAEGYWQGANEAAPPPPARMVSCVAEAVGGPGARAERDLPLFSASLGLTGRAECVVFPADRGAAPVPVLFRPPAVGAALDDDAQLAAQALCLGEMFGRRVEKSVFECHLDAAGWNRLRLALLAEIDPDCDSLRVYHLHDDAAGHTEHYGCARPADMTAAMIA